MCSLTARFQPALLKRKTGGPSTAAAVTARFEGCGVCFRVVSHLDFVAFSLFAGLPQCSLGITDNLFGIGVPLDGAIESNGDVGEVADGHCAMVAVHIADGLRSVGNAFEEVLHMVAGSFAFVEGFECFLFQGVGLQSIHGISGQFAAVDEDAAVGAFQQ